MQSAKVQWRVRDDECWSNTLGRIGSLSRRRRRSREPLLNHTHGIMALVLETCARGTNRDASVAYQKFSLHAGSVGQGRAARLPLTIRPRSIRLGTGDRPPPLHHRSKVLPLVVSAAWEVSASESVPSQLTHLTQRPDRPFELLS